MGLIAPQQSRAVLAGKIKWGNGEELQGQSGRTAVRPTAVPGVCRLLADGRHCVVEQ